MTENFNIRTVLVAPLDWGLGHASRCIPIIRALLQSGRTVILAGEGALAKLLQEEFPRLTCLDLAGYRVRYSKQRRLFSFFILLQSPKLFRSVSREHRWLNEVIDKYHIDLVISDNRFGLYSKKIPCVFITHQLLIKAPFPWLEVLIQKINYQYINRFTQCWVPDVEGSDNLAGTLSHPGYLPNIPVRYIGILSRFQFSVPTRRFDFSILLSGPEPQRSILEEKVIANIDSIPGKVLLVRGKPGATELPALPERVTVHNHLSSQQMEEAVAGSTLVVSRSGYTTVMELVSLRKKCLLIPTPGQTEQEYLAHYLRKKQVCFSVPQNKLDFSRHHATAMRFEFIQGEFSSFSEAMLEDLLSGLL